MNKVELCALDLGEPMYMRPLQIDLMILKPKASLRGCESLSLRSDIPPEGTDVMLGGFPDDVLLPFMFNEAFEVMNPDMTAIRNHLTEPQREAYTIIGDLVRAADRGHWQDTFLKARDDYLEAETTQLLQCALPAAQVLTNVSYPLAAGGEAEADIVVLCDDVLMVVECKAGRLGAATKRGAERQIVADLKATIAGGLNQAERFVHELVARGTMPVKAGSAQQPMAINGTRFRHVMRINVTLELIGASRSGGRPLAPASVWYRYRRS